MDGQRMMMVRLDLHTHIGEMFGFAPPTPDIAAQVIARIRAAGLDGVAVTDHWRQDWGLALHRVAEQHFPGQAIIIPGRRQCPARLPMPGIRHPGELAPAIKHDYGALPLDRHSG